MKGTKHRGLAVDWAMGRSCIVIVLLFAASAAHAAVRHVNPNNIACPGANGPLVYCSIQAAVDASVSGDEIYIAPGIYQESISLAGRPNNRGLTLIGSGISHTVIDSSTRGFFIQENVSIQHLSVEGVGATRSGMGGGIYVNDNVVVNINDMVVRNVHAGVGGGIAVLGGTLNLRRVAVINNLAEIYSTNNNSDQPSSGGGIFVAAGATLVAVDSVISGNTVNVGVDNPSKGQTGGGFGAGIYNLGTTTLVNTTISGNVANAVSGPASIPGGGITNGKFGVSAVLNVYNSTISRNSSNLDGGGIYNFNGTANVRNTIIAGNSGATTAPDCGSNSSNPFLSLGYNIIGSSTGCGQSVFPPGIGDSVGVPANLLNLQPVPTNSAAFDDISVFLLHAIGTGSRAIDYVGTSQCLERNNSPLNLDQRGVARPFDGNGDGTPACDAGAYEVNQDVVIYPTSLLTFEDQEVSTLYVALAGPPSQSVQVSFSSRDTTEGGFSTNSISFGTTDWNTPKPVFINVQNDGEQDGDQSYLIDVTVTGLTVPAKTISVTNIDTVTAPGVVTSQTSLNIQEGGSPATVQISLATPPATGSVVNLSIGRDLPSGNNVQETVNPTTMQFNDSNWNMPQSFSVTAIDDTIVDGDISYNLLISVDAGTTDPAYLSVNDSLIALTVRDNDQPTGTPGVIFQGVTGLTTSESGGQASFSVVLASSPSSDVGINFVSNAIDEGMLLADQNLRQELLITFTPLNWDQPQTVTVVGVDDIYADGGRLYDLLTQTITSDLAYRNINPADIRITNNDNEIPGITVTPTNGLITDESGATTTFQVQLTTPPVPSTQVQMSVTLQPPAAGLPLEGSVTLPPAQLIFNADNYNQPQLVTITGLDDCIMDGNQSYLANVSTNSTGTSSPTYHNANLQQLVTITNLDNDSANSPQILLNKTRLQTSEAGTSDSFEMRLAIQPSATVTITMTIPPNAREEGVFDTNSVTRQLTFNQSNWSAPQPVTVTGLDDSRDDGDQTYQIDIAPAVSADPGYADCPAPNVFVTNADNDEPNQQNPSRPGIVIDPPQSFFTTSENGGEANFSIALSLAPTSQVTVTLTIPNEYGDEGFFKFSDGDRPLIKTLFFSSTDWFLPQQVYVVGVDDAAIETNNASYDIIVTFESTDPQYANASTQLIRIINEDNDKRKPNNPDSGGGGGINPAWLCLLLGFVWIRYRCHRLFVRC